MAYKHPTEADFVARYGPAPRTKSSAPVSGTAKAATVKTKGTPKMAQYDENGVDVNYPYASSAESTKRATSGWSTFNNMSSGQQAAAFPRASEITFPRASEQSGTAPASRTAPRGMTGTEHLHKAQFGASYEENLNGLRSNLARAGWAAGSMPSSPMEAYRHNLRQAMLGSAASSQHSLGQALNETGGSMYAPRRTATPARRPGIGSRLLSKAKSIGGKVVGDGKGKKAKVKLPGPSRHEGKNARNLSEVAK